MPLEPPPEASYPDLDTAIKTAQDWARNHGYALVKFKHKKTNHNDKDLQEIRKLWMTCDKSGKPKLLEGVKRKTSSRKTDCPFKIVITRRPLPSRDWDIAIDDGQHNHPPSGSASAHPVHRKRTEEELDIIKSLSQSHIGAKHILLTLKGRDSDTAVTIQDIYNERGKLKAEEVGELTVCEALWKQVFGSSYWAAVRDNSDDGHLNRLFFAHSTGIKLAQNYPSVLLIDCTYRTNRYNMPLIHFAGVSPIGEGFSIGFAFIAQETEFFYRWALQQFKEFVLGDPAAAAIQDDLVFDPFESIVMVQPDVVVTDCEDALTNALRHEYPRVDRLLCRWHIEKNVLTAVQKVWRVTKVSDQEKATNEAKIEEFMAHWKAVVYSETEEEFDSRYNQLKSNYSSQPGLIEYLDREKYPRRMYFAQPWVKMTTHYGNTVTSKVEKRHDIMKRFIGTSKYDLLEVVKMIEDCFTIQYSELKTKIAAQRDRTPRDVDARRFPWLEDGINTEIVPRAVRLLFGQYTLYKEGLQNDQNTTCTGSFKTSMGIPCRHTIQERLTIAGGLKINATDFADFWRFIPRRAHWENRFSDSYVDPIIRANDDDWGQPSREPPASQPDDDWGQPFREPPASQPAIIPIDPLLPEPPEPPAPRVPVVTSPHKVKTKGRPRKDKSTSRNKSLWELQSSSRVVSILSCLRSILTMLLGM